MIGYIFGYAHGRISQTLRHKRKQSAGDLTQTEILAEQVDQLQDSHDRLSLVCMAMWSLMQDNTQITENDLIERVRKIDLMDGVEDGKVSQPLAKCSACNQTMSQRHDRCIYCGNDDCAPIAPDKTQTPEPEQV
ncbi:hypothetical protein [Poriferisphaera sp. WC338]|uniref:hypothetical protein n=1 Tax=Poriferisphaera sp. WC338 TaxID=3425129 RepID=UPI003D815985